MASTLPSAQTCCDPCTSPTTTAVPGPAGAAGAAGSNGTNGTNAYTTLSAQFTMPAELNNVTVSVVTSAPFGVGQIVYVKSGVAKGYFEIITIPSATQLELKNLEDGTTNAYLINSAPGTNFANGGTVSPAGLQGPAGSAANAAPDSATYITQTPNGTLTGEQPLSALATGIMFSTTATGVVSTIPRGVANTNIAPVDDAAGLTAGEALFATATGIESQAAATARTSLGLAIGTNVQAYDATLQSISALGTAGDRYAYTTGVDTWAEGTITSFARGLLDDSTAAAARTTLEIMQGYGLIAYGLVDANAIADTSLTVSLGRYRIDRIMCSDASINLTTARGGLFTAAGGGGTTLAADQVLSALTSTDKFVDLTKAAVVDTDVRTEGTLYFRIGTAQGAAATVEVRVYGWGAL